MIHLELGAKRVKQDKCEECGREHREWFEVEATREGLKGVDSVVRRWVTWADGEEMRLRGKESVEVSRVKRAINEKERANELGGYY